MFVSHSGGGGKGLASAGWELYGRDYDALATVDDAPLRFSATSLVVWLYGQIGVPLIDDLLALHQAGEHIIGSEVLCGDLVFRTGRTDRYHPKDHSHGVGHVGIYVGNGAVLHASYWSGIVGANPIEWYLNAEQGRFRGIRRIIAR
jgi:cell wall-associated NlpC family hydrolase